MHEKLNRADVRFLVVCLLLVAVSVAIAVRWFDSAFPEASIDFRVTREESQRKAEGLLKQLAIPTDGYRHASQFAHDDDAKIFLERKLGLEKANVVMRGQVLVWFWQHRWFKPLQTEEVSVAIAPTGEIVALDHRIPEDRVLPDVDPAAARRTAEALLASVGAPLGDLTLVEQSTRRLSGHTETLFAWESKSVRPAGTPYRYNVKLEGGAVSGYSQKLRVPDSWLRSYSELRSKNNAAASVDTLFLLLTMVASLVVFVVRLRRGDMQTRFVLAVGGIAAVLVALVALNGLPSAMVDYDTTTSFSAFITKEVVFALLQGIGVGLVLMVIVGSGETLYRERFPGMLAIPRLFRTSALGSRRVFKGFVLGYTLVAVFLAYQVVFYLVASHFGAWSPAEIPYDEILNTLFPWVAVLFMGFFPAMSEEFMSRAFSIPFIERLTKSRVAAVILAGFIWGFGHAAYPNQPFYIRGVEVGLAGVAIGILFYAFGLLPLLVWHYTVDALYTSLLLFRSHNLYYIASAALASLIFALPLILAIVFYLRRGGFTPDADLDNSAIGTVAPPPPAVAEEVPVAAPVAPRQPMGRAPLVLVGFAVIAAVLIWLGKPTLSDVVDYRIDGKAAKSIAEERARAEGMTTLPAKNVVIPDAGFRDWDAGSTREDGGSPGSFDDTALQYLYSRARMPYDAIAGVLRDRIRAGTWLVRFFTPKEKEEMIVEVDPRTSKAIGFHHYVAEEAAGATLEKQQAQALAEAAMRRSSLDPAAYEVKEALSFQQPKRRDWLFHLDSRAPLAGGAYERVTVRVAGDRVTQLARTVRIPEKDRRELSETTLVGTFLLILRILGLLAVLSATIFGFVVALRDGGFVWRRALRWALLLAVLPLLTVLQSAPFIVSQYDTSIAWETFMVMVAVGVAVNILMQVGGTFLAVSAIDSALPEARGALTPAWRRATAPAAVVAGLAATAVMMAFALLGRQLPRLLPGLVDLPSVGVSPMVAMPAPSLVVAWQSLFAALAGSAIIACLAMAFRQYATRRALLHAGIIAAITFALVDPSAHGAGIAVMLVRGLVTAAVLDAIVTLLLGGNLLAYPVAIFTLRMTGKAVDLLGNDRADLQLHGWIVLGILAIALLWLVMPALRRE